MGGYKTPPDRDDGSILGDILKDLGNETRESVEETMQVTSSETDWEEVSELKTQHLKELGLDTKSSEPNSKKIRAKRKLERQNKKHNRNKQNGKKKNKRG